MSDSYQRSFPPGTLRITTGCQYCAVGCGYNAFLEPMEAEPGEPRLLDGVSAHVTPAMRSTVRYRGKPFRATVAPDVFCDLNKGNHSIRGGTQGGNLVSHDGSGRSTRDRWRSPRVRLADGSWAEIDWPTLNEVMAELIWQATAMEVSARDETDKDKDGDKLVVREPDGLGVKIFEYQYLENTYAATKLFYSCLGTPNVAYHDRPSTSESSPGINDAGFRAHDFAYDDLRDADVVLVLGTNPYENQSVFFMQHLAGKQMIVLDPRYTATAQYAVETGGLFLQPTRVGAESLLLYALAREIIERYRAAHAGKEPRLRLSVGDALALRSKAKADYTAGSLKPDDMRRASRVMDYPELVRFLGVGTMAPTYTLTHAAEESGIAEEDLAETVSRIFQPEEDPERRPRVAILYEKGLMWGFNYPNTAAVATLALLLGSYGAPGRLVGRVGGHQKGWAEAKTKVDVFAGSSDEGYPYRSIDGSVIASSRNVHRDAHLRKVLDKDARMKRRRNLDDHVFVEHAGEEDVNLLWILGGNYLGQTNDARVKREKLVRRLEVGGARGRILRPKRATQREIIAALGKRIASRGLVLVQQDLLDNPTTSFCDLLIPAAGWGEDDFCRYNAQRRLKLYERFQDTPLHPTDAKRLEGRDPHPHRDSFLHSAKPDWMIVRDVAVALGRLADRHAAGKTSFAIALETAFPWEVSADVADEMSASSQLAKDSVGEQRVSMLGDLLSFAKELGIRKEEGRLHTVLGKGGEGLAPALRARYSIEGASPVHGNGVATNGVLLPVRLARDPQGKPLLEGTLRLRQTGPFFFVKAPWNEIESEFRRINRGSGDADEVLVLNGRINQLWNNMFHHLRNDPINEIFPEDLPGAWLEVNPKWAKARGISNGQIVELRSGRATCRGVASLQEAVPAGTAFALFSWPSRDEHGQLTFSGTVNNVTDGFHESLTSISALKYGRAVLMAVPHPKTKRDWIFPRDFPEHVPRLGPSFLPRNVVRPGPAAPGPRRPAWSQKRSDWEMRELIVQRGLTRALIRRPFSFPPKPQTWALADGSAHRVSLPHQADFRTGRFWRLPDLTPQQFLAMKVADAPLAAVLGPMLRTNMPAGMLAPRPLEQPAEDLARIERIEILLGLGTQFGQAALKEVQELLDDLIDRPHRVVADLFHQPDEFLALLQLNPEVLRRLARRLDPGDHRRMEWRLRWADGAESVIDTWQGFDLAFVLRWIRETQGALPAPSPAPTFSGNIRPLFTDEDVSAMMRLGIDLSDYRTVKERGAEILARVESDIAGFQMPPASSGRTWPKERVDLFRRWIISGYPP